MELASGTHMHVFPESLSEVVRHTCVVAAQEQAQVLHYDVSVVVGLQEPIIFVQVVVLADEQNALSGFGPQPLPTFSAQLKHLHTQSTADINSSRKTVSDLFHFCLFRRRFW